MMVMMSIMAEEAVFSHGVVAIVPRSPLLDRHTQMIVLASLALSLARSRGEERRERELGKVSGFAALQSDSRNVCRGGAEEGSGVDSRQRAPFPSHPIMKSSSTSSPSLSPLIEMSSLVQK